MRLPSGVVEPLIAEGSIYADRRANAVFLLLGKGEEPVGAEIRGTSTPWRGMAPGSKRTALSSLAIGSGCLFHCDDLLDAVPGGDT